MQEDMIDLSPKASKFSPSFFLNVFVLFGIYLVWSGLVTRVPKYKVEVPSLVYWTKNQEWKNQWTASHITHAGNVSTYRFGNWNIILWCKKEHCFRISRYCLYNMNFFFPDYYDYFFFSFFKHFFLLITLTANMSCPLNLLQNIFLMKTSFTSRSWKRNAITPTGCSRKSIAWRPTSRQPTSTLRLKSKWPSTARMTIWECPVILRSKLLWGEFWIKIIFWTLLFKISLYNIHKNTEYIPT